MKEKITAFFKKPLNVVTVALAFFGIIGIILTCVVPAGTYYFKTIEDGETFEEKLVLKSDKLDIFNKEDGEWYSITDNEGMEYKIEKGKLFIGEDGDYDEIGTINGIALTSTDGDKYTNKLALAFLIVSSVFFVAGSAWIVYSIIDEKKKVA